MRRLLALACLAALSHSERAMGQRTGVPGPQVQKYLRVSTPGVVLEHVNLIDGTGAAPRPDQNIYIAGGTITAISAGRDEPPKGGVTVLDLRGYSVMPGIV